MGRLTGGSYVFCFFFWWNCESEHMTGEFARYRSFLTFHQFLSSSFSFVDENDGVGYFDFNSHC